jgi:succinoglycan biosynthesis transport protein ExoP
MNATQTEMTLRDYGNVVLRRKWIVIAATLIATVLAVVLSAAQTPVYSSSAQVLVQSRGQDGLSDDRQANLNYRNIETEIQVIEGQAVSQRVEQNLGLDSQAPGVNATSVGDSDVISLTIRSTNATNAATLANAYAASYIQVRREQSVEELLAASTEVQNAITELQASVSVLADDDPSRAGLVAQLANFNSTLDQLRVDAALRTGGATIIKDAEVPSSPVEPTPLRTAVLAFVVGLLIGLGAAFLLDYLDDKVRTEDDLERLVVHPVLSVVPIDPPPDNRPITVSRPRHFSVEAYRGLRTNIQFLGLDVPLKVIQVTSSLPGEGKTTTACNLAVVLAQAGHKVALVDADLRRPRVHEVFGLSAQNGFTDLLLGAEPKDVVKHVDTEVGLQLSVYTAGTVPSNPSEMLSARRTRPLLNEMAKHYEYVIVDSPPILPVSDAVALSGAVDGVLVVVHAGRVAHSDVTETMERLDRVTAPVVGLVLNQVTKTTKTEYSYGGYSTIVPASTVDATRDSTPIAAPAEA